MVGNGQKWVYLLYNLVVITLAERCYSSQTAFHATKHYYSVLSGLLYLCCCTEWRYAGFKAHQALGFSCRKDGRMGTTGSEDKR